MICDNLVLFVIPEVLLQKVQSWKAQESCWCLPGKQQSLPGLALAVPSFPSPCLPAHSGAHSTSLIRLPSPFWLSLQIFCNTFPLPPIQSAVVKNINPIFHPSPELLPDQVIDFCLSKQAFQWKVYWHSWSADLLLRSSESRIKVFQLQITVFSGATDTKVAIKKKVPGSFLF